MDRYLAFRPYDWTPELRQAVHVVRDFLRRNPQLHGRVLNEYAFQQAYGIGNPQAVVVHALRADSQQLCDLLASPLGEIALSALTFEFPGGILLDLLPVAAKIICAERRRNGSTAVAVLAAGVGLLILAFAGRK